MSSSSPAVWNGNEAEVGRSTHGHAVIRLDFVVKSSLCPYRTESGVMTGGADTDGEENGHTAVPSLIMLLGLAITVIEDAHAVATTVVPADQNAQLARTGLLLQAGTDLLAIANACNVVIRQADK